MGPYVKVCACGAGYTAAEWERLPLVGHLAEEDGGPMTMRNCPCGSTLAVETGPSRWDAIPGAVACGVCLNPAKAATTTAYGKPACEECAASVDGKGELP